MNIRHLRYFVALAREGHHGRAAAACHVTQPTLTEAIRQLENELGVPLLERGGQRFRGLTAEGQRILGWAQYILADEDALRQELVEMRQGLSGTLRLATIPAAIAAAPLVVTPFTARHPLVTVRVISTTSIQIQRGLDESDLEVGLTYLDNEPLRGVRAIALYRERYVLLTSASGPFAGRDTVSWQEAAEMRLCLLTPEMQNRRIIDGYFRQAGVATPRAGMETNSLFVVYAHVRLGGWSSIVPHSLLGLLGPARDGLHALPLVAPSASQMVGIVARARDPMPPLVRAFLATARQTDTAARLRALMPHDALGDDDLIGKSDQSW